MDVAVQHKIRMLSVDIAGEKVAVDKASYSE
jgi:hypothetical protein